MDPVLEAVIRWKSEGRRAALATIVEVQQSAPLGPGTWMAVCEDGEVVGSVSGGCVEGAVYEEAMDAIATEQPRVVTYGISDDEAFGVGLTCGGVITLYIEEVSW